MGKGSKRREAKVDRTVFESNWDRIFNKDKADLAFESDNPLERPYEPATFWEHTCKNNGQMSIQKGSACNWCGLREDGLLD